MDTENEMTGVTPAMVDHTNMQGDIASDKKHFAEVSFDGFRTVSYTHLTLPTNREV